MVSFGHYFWESYTQIYSHRAIVIVMYTISSKMYLYVRFYESITSSFSGAQKIKYAGSIIYFKMTYRERRDEE